MCMKEKKDPTFKIPKNRRVDGVCFGSEVKSEINCCQLIQKRCVLL